MIPFRRMAHIDATCFFLAFLPFLWRKTYTAPELSFVPHHHYSAAKCQNLMAHSTDGNSFVSDDLTMDAK